MNSFSFTTQIKMDLSVQRNSFASHFNNHNNSQLMVLEGEQLCQSKVCCPKVLYDSPSSYRGMRNPTKFFAAWFTSIIQA